MTAPVRYGQPKRLNVVTVTMLLLLLAAGYWMWRFFPAYFDSWSVAHILRESVAEVYKASRLNEASRGQALQEIVDRAITKIRSPTRVGITDPDLVVNLEIDPDTQAATMTADYCIVVTHPWITQTTTLRFHQSETMSVKKVNWE